MAPSPKITKTPKCVVHAVAKQKGRDPFAAPGVSGSRWMAFGCDGRIPAQYTNKVVRAVKLAYDLASKPAFIHRFDKLVKTTAKGDTRTYIDALDAVVLNLAEASADPKVKAEIREASEAKKADSLYQIEPAFTFSTLVYIREFALKNYTDKHLAGTITHEACHVAGVPGDLFADGLINSVIKEFSNLKPP